MKKPFRYFNSSPEIIRLTVMMYVRYPLSLRQVSYHPNRTLRSSTENQWLPIIFWPPFSIVGEGR